jgi:hypothetical protein
MRPAAKLMAFAVGLALLAGCGEVRPRGEAGGIPVAFVVDTDWSYLDGFASLAAPSPLYVPAPYHAYRYHGPVRHRPYGYAGAGPYWYDPDPFYAQQPTTAVYLLGGDGPAEAGVFRMPLDRRHEEFTVPIRAGHVVTLTVQARGAREGWEAVGHFTAADHPGQRVHLSLLREGPRMEVTPPPADGPAPQFGPPAP